MITEFGSANGTQCQPYLEGMLGYMRDNPEYIGWTAWAAGPFWGTYSACCTDSQQWGSLEPGSKAGDGGPGMYETVCELLPFCLQPCSSKLRLIDFEIGLAIIQKFVPKALVWSGISSVTGGILSTRG